MNYLYCLLGEKGMTMNMIEENDPIKHPIITKCFPVRQVMAFAQYKILMTLHVRRHFLSNNQLYLTVNSRLLLL